MCYSAMVQQDYDIYVRDWGADISIKEFFELYYKRRQMPLGLPKGMDANFAAPESDDERAIKALIDDYNASQATKLETELFTQKQRLNTAARALQTKTTKKASEDVRIATNKIERAETRLADLRRKEPKDRDARIFPGWYAPVMVMEGGKRVVRPMRYQCRPAGKPVAYDRKYPGTYNARRDNLGGFWKDLFCYKHAVMVVNAFFENVARHDMEHRELVEGEEAENVVLEFRPQPRQDMLIACLWSEWSGAGEPNLLSFAAITDEPPPEVAAAGHDRVIIQIKPENIDAWLNPDHRNLQAQQAILEDRARPYYEHRLAHAA